jgi:hypothetical protein
MTTHLLAQTTLGNITGVGTIGTPADTFYDTATTFENVISVIIGALTTLAGLYFFIQLILSGYQYMSAGGDKAQTQAAQKKLTNAIIGLIIVVAAYLITGLIGRVFGFNILYFRGSLIHLWT